MDVSDSIFGSPGQAKPGMLLLANPFMGDGNFRRTVVLLVEHNESGSLGYVLNRPLELQLGHVLEAFGDSSWPLYQGGPVELDTLHLLHKSELQLAAGKEVAPNVSWGGNLEQLAVLMGKDEISEQDVRLLIGYSGWGAGQLDDELKHHSWILCPAEAQHVFETPHKRLWEEVLRSRGGEFAVLANFPSDPKLN